MTLQTTHFGMIAVDESAVIEFPGGLPGFEDRRRFVPLQHGQAGELIFLQSLETPDLCFLALPVQVIRPEYELSVSPEDLEILGAPLDRQPTIGTDVAAISILTLQEGEAPTANLRSPVVIHLGSRRAVQAIRPDECYEIREALAVARNGAVCS